MKRKVFRLISMVVFAIGVTGCASNAVDSGDSARPADEAAVNTPAGEAVANSAGEGAANSAGEFGYFWQSGIATQEFQGDGLVAAHSSLPLGSKAFVTNPKNGKELEVTISGRIPPSGRAVDLSPAVGRLLDLLPNDLVLLRIPINYTAPAASGNFTQRGIATHELRADGLAAAHSTLPLNSKAKVTNTRNSKEIEVTITGRIAASVNRAVDLSPAAWQALDMAPNDTVVLSVLAPPRPRTPAASSGTQAAATPSQQPGIDEEALERAARALFRDVPQRTKIAVIYITAPGRSITDFITGELEHIWMDAGYIITGRNVLNRIREEHKFPISGEVEDAIASSIGIMADADIIVTGRVDGEGSLRRLRLQAKDTHTAEVIRAVSERI